MIPIQQTWVRTQLYGFKQSHPKLIIFKHWFDQYDSNSYNPITLDLSGPGSDRNVLYTL